MNRFLALISRFFRVVSVTLRLGPRTYPTLFVSGRYLYDAAGKQVILRGVNLALLDDWGFPQADKLAQVEKTRANAIRIQWYKNYGSPDRPPYTATDLDGFLTKCAANRIIPILGLWDLTCNSDPNLLNSQLIPWWTSNAIVTVLQKHKKYLIINLANELGAYHWAGDDAAQATALTNFKNAYKSAITSVRNAGLEMPIMIDAPDCGTSIDAFTIIGQELVNYDPKHNLLLSAHAYWAEYDDGIAKFQAALHAGHPIGLAAGLPIVFGEVANKQYGDSDNDQCHYALDGTGQNNPPPSGFQYQDLLTTLKANNTGWLAWGWWPDGCASRQMSEDGSFDHLTIFGQDIVNNAVYGLKNTAIRSSALP